MKSFPEVHDLLLAQHKDQYDHFTRLMLTLSVGFITFTTALQTSDTALYSAMHKAGILSHGLSILFAIWLQYILVQKPILELNQVSELFKTSDEISAGRGVYFPRNPSKIQQICFLLQIIFFLLAFAITIIKTIT